MHQFLLKNYPAFSVIIAYTLCAHLLLLTNDLPYWDGWIYHIAIKEEHYEDLLEAWNQNGRIILGEIYLWLGKYFGTVTGFHIVAVIAITVSGLLYYILLLRHSFFTPFESLIAVLLGVSYPAYQVHLASTALFYIEALPFFIMGILLLLENSCAPNQKNRLVWRILAHIMLIASYVSEAYVIAGLIVPFIVWARKFSEHRKIAGSLYIYYKRYADFPLVAIAYIGVMCLFMPAHGAYSNSRDINISPLALLQSYHIYYASALDFNIVNLATYRWHHDVNLALWLALIAYGVIFYQRCIIDKSARMHLLHICFLLIVLGAIASPFTVAQRHASTFGFTMRHLTPVGFLVGTIFVSVVGYFVQRKTLRRHILMGLAALSLLTLSKDYAYWQTQGAFEHSVMEHMRDNKLMQNASFLFMEKDRNYFRDRFHKNQYEMMLQEVYGTSHQWIIFSSGPLSDSMYQDELIWHTAQCNNGGPNKAVPVDRSGCQISLQLQPSVKSLHWYTGLQYLWLRLTATEQQRRDWTRKLVDISTEPLANCATSTSEGSN